MKYVFEKRGKIHPLMKQTLRFFSFLIEIKHKSSLKSKPQAYSGLEAFRGLWLDLLTTWAEKWWIKLKQGVGSLKLKFFKWLNHFYNKDKWFCLFLWVRQAGRRWEVRMLRELHSALLFSLLLENLVSSRIYNVHYPCMSRQERTSMC